jgi:molybdate transport system ATP-binding protein
MTLDVKIECRRGGFMLKVDVRFHPKITALFGSSGAGKSTLLHCIAGLIRPDCGQINLQQNTLLDTDNGVCVPAHKRRIGLVFQDNRLFPHLSVRGNLAFAQAGIFDKRAAETEKIISLLEIGPLLNRAVTSLSGGEKKRVALARAILNNPRWLLLDEPFSGLDEPLKEQIIIYLLRLQQAVSIPMILVSHSRDEIVNLADEVIFLEKGLLTGRGKVTFGAIDGSASFCRSQESADLQNVKNWLMKNHSLRFRPYRRSETDHLILERHCI